MAQSTSAQSPEVPEDMLSYARPLKQAAVTRTNLFLKVDFENKVLDGVAILDIDTKNSKYNEVVLDNYKLKIISVTQYTTEVPLDHQPEAESNYFGSKFIIKLPNVGETASTSSDRRTRTSHISRIQITYKTSSESPALYWLKPEQTSDGIHHLLISNSKLTYARAIFPCQDTPSHKISFECKIEVPRGYTVKMPGNCRLTVDGNQNIYSYNISNMPSYAMYIIVGALQRIEKQKYNRRCKLWFEMNYNQERAKNNFGIILDVINIFNLNYGFSENFEICLLPPNIPEFGMQCPHMTFVSSTTLEDNVSIMLNTIVPNILESWIGRRVTIATFRHAWLIKSFSTFIFRNHVNDIIPVPNENMQEFLKLTSINNLMNMQIDVTLVPNCDTNILLHCKNKYVTEKGCLFLMHLQEKLGGFAVFLRFVKYYLRGIQIITADFKKHVSEFFRTEVLRSEDWSAWVYGPNLPTNSYSINKTDWRCLADRWIETEAPEGRVVHPNKGDLQVANALIKIEFLNYVHASPTVPTRQKLEMLQYAFLNDLQDSREIKFLWLRLCLKNPEMCKAQEALDFARDYCMPRYACSIFRDVYNCSDTSDLATEWYNVNLSKMVPETITELRSILEPSTMQIV